MKKYTLKKYTHKTRDGSYLARIIVNDLGGKFPVAAAVKHIDEKSDFETIKLYYSDLKAYNGYESEYDLIEYSFWETVPVDTQILVRDSISENWQRRHFSHYKDGKVYAFQNGATSWTVQHESLTASWNFATE